MSSTTHETVPRRRWNAVRIRLPGFEAPEHRVTDPIALTEPIKQALSQGSIDKVELLAMPGTDQQELLAIGHSAETNAPQAYGSVLGGSDLEPSADTQKTLLTAFDASETDSTLEPLIKRHLPSGVRTQSIHVNLRPLQGISPLTSVLILPAGQQIPPISTWSSLIVRRTLNSLHAANIPYLLQVLITEATTNARHEYLLTARLAVFDDEYGVISGEDLQAHIEGDYQYDFANYAPNTLTSNFNLPVEELKTHIKENRYLANRLQQVSTLSLRRGTLQDLVVGRSEWRRLLNAAMTTDDRYEELFSGYARMPVSTAVLPHFTIFPAQYQTYQVWDRIVGADQPGLLDQDTHRLPDRSQTPPSTTSSSAASESEEHKRRIEHRLLYEKRQGNEIVAVDLDTLELDTDILDGDPTDTHYFTGRSRPDLVVRDDGQIRLVEIELHNDASGLLTNLARADYHGYPVTIVFAEKRTAKTKCGVTGDDAAPIKQPFKIDDDGRTIFYNTTGDVINADGQTYVLPRELSQSRWQPISDTDIALIGPDGTVYAQGDIEADVSTFDFQTPRTYEEGEYLIVESATGSEIDRFPTTRVADTPFTKISPPLVPTRREYLSIADIEYRVGDDYTRYLPEAEWSLHYDTSENLHRYGIAGMEYLTRYTISEPGSKLFTTEVHDQFKEWYEAQSDRPTPDVSNFARGLRDYGSVSIRKPDGRKSRFPNRTFRFPVGLESPHLPFIDP